MYDVAVIGSGIVGSATACELSRYALRIVLLEKENDVACGTSKANSAILHAGYDPPPGSEMARLNVEGAALAAEYCEKLDVPYKACGSLVLAFSEEETATVRALYERGLQNGVPGLELWDAEKIQAEEPQVSKAALLALHAPTAAIVSPWEYTLALAETAAKNGAEIRLNAEVLRIDAIEGGYRLHTAGGIVEAARVVNAAGLHADAVHNMVAEPTFRILPERGEYYLLDKSECFRAKRTLFQCPTKLGKGVLISPTAHGNLLVGPNNEQPKDADDVATTAEGLSYVEKTARITIPDFDLRQNIRTFSGNRANSTQEDFIIQPAAEGFIDLAGIKSPGLTAAPAIAKVATRLLAEDGMALREKDDFVMARKRPRFAELSMEEKAAAIRKNPAYGHIICRCETVTEGEILDTLQTPIPPRTVDGVKRRCNAGMGRCQGGFCGPRVVEILAREYGVSPLEIEQDRAGSYILDAPLKGGCHDAE